MQLQSPVTLNPVEAVDAADPTQRVLKPYGVAMLPDQHKQERESQQDADARAEEVARSAAEAKQNDKVEAAEQQAFAAKAEEAQVNARAVVEPMEPKEAPPRPQASNAIPPEEGPQKQESRAEPPKQSPKPET